LTGSGWSETITGHEAESIRPSKTGENKVSELKEIIETGYSTDILEIKLRELFATDKELIGKVERTLESVEPEKRENMRELVIETYICDLVLMSHIREAKF
jgi:hypothetical protein